MFTIEQLDRLQDCLAALEVINEHQDISPHDEAASYANELYEAVREAKEKLLSEQCKR